ncbi:MAG TPA: nuclear transport factor 2 family protein [bacterium]|nr:nuclear transport factor 2 family protein [bacterium]
MDFSHLLAEFSQAVVQGDGRRLGALFTPAGVYHDTFYGEFRGPEAIRQMLEERFHRDAERFLWEFYQPLANETLGYARWRFSYTSRMAHNAGARVAFEGMSQFDLAGGKIQHYGEMFNAGVAFVQLGLDPARMEKVFQREARDLRARPPMARHWKA